MKHSLEPWEFIERDNYIVSADIGVLFIWQPSSAEVSLERRNANAHRMIACVNAMAGVENPQLAIDNAREMLRRINEIAKAEPMPHHDFRGAMQLLSESALKSLGKLEQSPKTPNP